MTQKDRTEIRDMIHDILSGWQAGTISREEVTNVSLKNIDGHLARLNGSVIEHSKLINENLPHSIAHCLQAKDIETLKENMVTEKAVKKTIYIGFGILATLIGIIWGISEIFFK